MAKDVSLKMKLVELRAQGSSYASIAQELGIAKQTAITWSRELRHDIANSKSLEWDTAREKWRIAREHRISLLSAQLDRVRQELEKRDLSDVPTGKLIDLTMRLSASLKAEDSPVSFTEAGPDIFHFDDEPKDREWTA